MENEIGVEAEELSKREKYRERRSEEYDIVSKVAFLIGVPDSHWKSQYTGLDSDMSEEKEEKPRETFMDLWMPANRRLLSLTAKTVTR